MPVTSQPEMFLCLELGWGPGEWAGGGEEGLVEKEARQGVAGTSAPSLLPTGCENMKENVCRSRERLSHSWRTTNLAFRHCWHPL